MQDQFGPAFRLEGGGPPSLHRPSALNAGEHFSGNAACRYEHDTTTFIVRNVSPETTMSDVLTDWPIDGSFDFLYLPMSTGGRYALGNPQLAGKHANSTEL